MWRCETLVKCVAVLSISFVLFLAGCSLQEVLKPNERPVARFTWTRIGEALTFQFDASQSYDPDGTIQSYRWDFGDGTVEFGQVVKHTFPKRERTYTYSVRLTVTDDRGATSSATQEIKIEFNNVFIAEVRNAIDYWNPITRNFAANCIQPNNSGKYNIGQICDIWDVCRRNWVYVSDPWGGMVFNPTPASQTILANLRGDCDDFAVLLAATVTAIGGGTRFVVAAKGTSEAHAYAEVYMGIWGSDDLQRLTNYICNRYGIDSVWYWVESDGSAWLNLDWWELHPGGWYYQGERILVIYPWLDGRAHPLSELSLLPTGEVERAVALEGN